MSATDFKRYRDQARALFPVLHQWFIVLTSGPDISWEHFNAAAIPQYNIPPGFDVNEAQRVSLSGYHEPGHEFEEYQRQRDPQKKHRQAFLTLIGESRSWDALKAEADALTTAGRVNEGHEADPGEWWADAFANAVAGVGKVGPWRVQAADPLRLQAFFQGLIGIVPAPPAPTSWPIIQAPSPYFSRGWWNPPTNIALHSAATTLASLLQTFTSPTSTRKVSAHFTVDGFTQKIYQHVDLANRAWHAIDANEFAIGIETIDGKAWGIHPEVTYAMTAWLVRTKIAPTLGLAINDEVIGPHSRWVATACPANLDWARIITEAGGTSEVPTEAQWQQHLADEANAHTAVRNVLAQLAHAKHSATVAINPHVLDPNIRAALKKLDQAVVTQQKHAAQSKRKGTAASARVGHGRGKSKDVED